MLEHWIRVQAIVQYEAGATRPLPRGAIPTPPHYRECIEYLAARARPRGEVGVSAVTGILRERCVRQYNGLREQAFEKLIIPYWIHEEAARAGVAVRAREVNAALARRFPTVSALHRFLTLTGLRRSDEEFIVSDELLLGKWQRKVLPVYARLRRAKQPESAQMAGEVDTELTNLDERTRKAWVPKTYCRSGYVIPLCGHRWGVT
jgi:hypothetical protein